MNGKEYLEQISSSVRPEKKPTKGFLSSTLFKVIIGGIVGFIIIAIVGMALGDKTVSVQDEALELNLYIDSTTGAISKYQPSLKSSALRSYSASLNSVLSNTTREVETFLENTYGRDKSRPDKTMEEDEKLHADGLDTDLFEAKINGILDRIFAHKMAYEITMIMSRESDIYDRVSDGNLRTALDSSYNSLTNLYEQFNNFSEAN